MKQTSQQQRIERAQVSTTDAAALRAIATEAAWIDAGTFDDLDYEGLVVDADAGRQTRSRIVGGRPQRFAKLSSDGRAWIKANK